jgi:LmbE family N-acetylglucosaminyl deacetylase
MTVLMMRTLAGPSMGSKHLETTLLTADMLLTMRHLTLLLFLWLCGCHWGPRVKPSEKSTNTVELLIVAPHPDDEVLMAGGALWRALREGRRAGVIVVTNGDFTCARDGAQRQRESLAALAQIGLPESQVYFLGYADGYLEKLSHEPLRVERLNSSGECLVTDTTWSTRGAAMLDAHQATGGHEAPLTRASLLRDLSVLLAQLQPSHIYAPHELDAHSDHAATTAALKEALLSLRQQAVLHKSLIHTKDACWPGVCGDPFRPHETMPAAGSPYETSTIERISIDASLKLNWIRQFHTQYDEPLESDWISGFARRDEVFYLERL